MNKKIFSINLNFDSLGEAYGWPSDLIEDTAFTRGVDRILNLGNQLNTFKAMESTQLSMNILIRSIRPSKIRIRLSNRKQFRNQNKSP